MKKLLLVILSVAMIFAIGTAFSPTVNAEEYSTIKVTKMYFDGASSYYDEVANQGVPPEVTNNTPVISWDIGTTEAGQSQSAYSIVVASSSGDMMWNSGWVSTSTQSAVYSGKSLTPGTKYNAGIVLKDNNGNTNSADSFTFYAVSVVNITADQNTGDSSITMFGTTVPSPSYTVIIPEKIDFGTATKKVKSTADADAIKKTDNYTVTANYEYLFENEKNLTVTMTTDNKVADGINELNFKLYKSDDSAFETGAQVMKIQPSAVEKSTKSQDFYAALDQRFIKTSGSYNGIVNFTVALADNV